MNEGALRDACEQLRQADEAVERAAHRVDEEPDIAGKIAALRTHLRTVWLAAADRLGETAGRRERRAALEDVRPLRAAMPPARR